MTLKKGDIVKDKRTGYMYLIKDHSEKEDYPKIYGFWYRLQIFHSIRVSDIEKHFSRMNKVVLMRGKYGLVNLPDPKLPRLRDKRTTYEYKAEGPVDAKEPSILLNLDHLIAKDDLERCFEVIDR